MAFKNPAEIASEMLKGARFLKRGDKDPFDGCKVVEPRYYYAARADVNVHNGRAVMAEIRKQAKNDAQAHFGVEAVAHMAMPRASHDERDAFKR